MSAQKINWPELARVAKYSAKRMAEIRGRSVRQLEREFLRRFRQTPEEWINDLRLRDARELLEQRNGEKIEAIAMSLGYKHYASFSRAFKQFHGASPSQIGPRLNAIWK